LHDEQHLDGEMIDCGLTKALQEYIDDTNTHSRNAATVEQSDNLVIESKPDISYWRRDFRKGCVPIANQ
jgi:hypothetical protein